MPGTLGFDDGVGGAARFSFPVDLVGDGAGTLYLTDANRIRKMVVATGEVTTIAGSTTAYGNRDDIGTAAAFNQPTGLALDGKGNLYVADTVDMTIRRIDLSTTQVVTIAGNPNAAGAGDGTASGALFLGPRGMVCDGAGHLFISDSHAIRRLDVTTAAVTTIVGKLNTTGASDGVGNATRFNDPHDLALDGAGNLYVADYGNNAIRKVELSTGVVRTIVGVPTQKGVVPGPLPAKLSTPWGVAVDAMTGGLVIVDSDENVVLAASMNPP
jgi:sugar lactone lactonase YvrE